MLVCSDASVAVYYLVRMLFRSCYVNLSSNINSVRTNVFLFCLLMVVVVSGNVNRVGALLFLPFSDGQTVAEAEQCIIRVQSIFQETLCDFSWQLYNFLMTLFLCNILLYGCWETKCERGTKTRSNIFVVYDSFSVIFSTL